MKFDQSLFQQFKKNLFTQESQFIFVSDLFAEQYTGGAELTLQALLDSCPYPAEKINSKDITLEHIKEGVNKYWIFGNYVHLNLQLIPAITANLRYSILECDYKFCKYRSPELHLIQTGNPCDCHTKDIGKFISSFMAGADCTWWMSAAQRQEYLNRFPFLIDYKQIVLSSVFSPQFFDKISQLRSTVQKNNKWLILDSNSWIKGTNNTVEYAKSLGLDYELVGNIKPDEMLEKLASSYGLIFRPEGGDTCPRLVIEAKLLGCKLELNSNVQHAQEKWFNTEDISSIEFYLKNAIGVFWNEMKYHFEKSYTLSGYTTTYNCIKQDYPFIESIESMLGFCDEVVVVDGGSSDGTLEALRELQMKHMILGAEDMSSNAEELNLGSRLSVVSVPRDWNGDDSALYDGMQKAEARKLCTCDFAWQMDVDEIVRKEDFQKIRQLIQNFPKAVPMLSLPVVEYWGATDKVRLDITPWKWRLSRNSPRITHGIPAHLRSKDANGRDISLPGSDGCDLVDASNGEPIVFLGFLTQEADEARRQALNGNQEALYAYQAWFENVIHNVPSVYHLSWLNIESKIKKYSTSVGSYGWTRHWEILNGKKYEDTSESNMFFDKPWSHVTDEDIKIRAKELATGTGGWVAHKKWDGTNTPSMNFKNITVPKEVTDIIMKSTKV